MMLIYKEECLKMLYSYNDVLRYEIFTAIIVIIVATIMIYQILNYEEK